MEKLSYQLCTVILQEGVRLHENIATSLGSESGSETDRPSAWAVDIALRPAALKYYFTAIATSAYIDVL